jgi:hypothetical protein
MKTNYKSIILSLGLAVMGLMFFNGANAQDPWTGVNSQGDYSQSTFTNSTPTVFEDKITVNKFMPYWVWPSAAYNPSFDETQIGTWADTASITNNVISKFTWDAGTGSVQNRSQNYIEISWNTTGDKTISVTETPAAGICYGLPVYMGIHVIDEPSGWVTATTKASPALGLDSVLISGCENDAALLSAASALSFMPTNSEEEYPYNVNLNYKVYNIPSLDASGNIDPTEFKPANEITTSANVKVNGIDGTTNPSNSNPIVLSTSSDKLVGGKDYAAENSKITVYEFTYNNINGKISRKSDYLAARGDFEASNPAWTSTTSYGKFSYYPAAAVNTKYYIVVFPKPVTGPIYHISNGFGY